MPEFVGIDAQWIQHKVKPPPPDKPTGEHPVMLLSELYRDATYVFAETSSDGVSYVCSIELQERSYEGTGRTKKAAKLATATMAVAGLAADGILEKRRTDVAAAREVRQAKRAEIAERRKLIIEQRKVERQNRERKNPPTPKNAVMRLHDLGVRPNAYSLVAIHDVNGHSEFTVSVLARGQIYAGKGMSKRRAKLEAAESALKGMDEWTEQDDEIKKEIVAKDDKKVDNAMAATSPSGDGKKKKKKKKSKAKNVTVAEQLPPHSDDGNMQDKFDVSAFESPAPGGYAIESKPQIVPDFQPLLQPISQLPAQLNINPGLDIKPDQDMKPEQSFMADV